GPHLAQSHATPTVNSSHPTHSPLGPPQVGLGVLVTGGAGFLGSCLVAELIARGARVVVMDDFSSGSRARLGTEGPRLRIVEGDAGEANTWQRALAADPRPDRIVHLAGTVGVRRVLADPDRCLRNHRLLAQALVEAWEGLPADRKPEVLCASSSEVYRESRSPLAETSPTLDAGEPRFGQGRWAYARAKLATEARLAEAQIPALIVRLFNVVGPGQTASSGMVLPRFIEAARAHRRLALYGDGEQLRTYGHVRAVAADLATLVLASHPVHGILNLGGMAQARTIDLAQAVLAGLGQAPDRVEWVDPTRSVSRDFEEVRHRVPDLTRAQSLGLVRSPWTLQAIVRDGLLHHPQAANRLDPPASHLPSPSHEHCPHPDPLESGRSREAGLSQ
ncbi:MAG TPA: NAD-dependent epimerase/dehydratase family protein, partial [Planctomycetota bacterium]|nr:NAD-dependent epimerase/dehydratase family protein [Planctomycetota bacterium]